MLRSLFSGITGLRAHQTMMDVVGNNIANVNSVGYKSSTVVFEDTLSQAVRGAGAAQNSRGGTNPMQIGLGVKVASISTNFTQGAPQNTGNASDLMIQGDGFFVVRDGGTSLYTRNGAFALDSSGLLTSGGLVVQGWPGTNGVINANGAPSDIRLPIGTILSPVTTEKGALSGNLPADAAADTVIATSVTAYDSQGKAHKIDITIKKNAAANSWDVKATDSSAATGTPPVAPTVGTATLAFDANGKLTSPTTMNLTGPQAITVDLTGLSQYGGDNTLTGTADGSAMGGLQGYTIAPDGTVVGVFSNGLKQSLAQIALASFNNPGGLEKVGNSNYRTTVNSGAPQLGTAGSAGKGSIAGGMLEMSNVDLAQEFTNLIISQRGFQANSRVITASDELLQDLVNIKR